jgi:small subunit ribosomal protein S16
MALAIRMSRAGARNQPFYRIVVADSRYPRDGRYLERLGTYNPLLPKDHKERIVFKLERVKHWLGVGAKPSDRVQRFLAAAGVMEGPKIPTNADQPQKSAPKTKAQERTKSQAEAAAKAAEAKAE